jgi:hypothetical protein
VGRSCPLPCQLGLPLLPAARPPARAFAPWWGAARSPGRPAGWPACSLRLPASLAPAPGAALLPLRAAVPLSRATLVGAGGLEPRYLPAVGKRSVLPITAIRFNPDSTSQRNDRSIVAISGNAKSQQKCLLNWSYVALAAHSRWPLNGRARISSESDSAALAPLHQGFCVSTRDNVPCSVHNCHARAVLESIRERSSGVRQVRASRRRPPRRSASLSSLRDLYESR